MSTEVGAPVTLQGDIIETKFGKSPKCGISPIAVLYGISCGVFSLRSFCIRG